MFAAVCNINVDFMENIYSMSSGGLYGVSKRLGKD
jgi:hypothetical protein